MKILLLGLTLAYALSPVASATPMAFGQNPAASAPGRFQLQVVTDGTLLVSIDADNARLGDVTAELSRRLGVPVGMSPALMNERLRLRLDKLPFESALSALAPRAYVDYDVRSGRARPRGVFLTNVDEAEPEPRGGTHGILVSGNTEDVNGTADDALQVSYESERLTVFARAQSLWTVLLALGETLNVPVDFEGDPSVRINANFRLVRVEEALLALSPNVTLHVRADLYRGTRKIQRIVLSAAA
jgi:hypothetical protein